MTKYVSKIFERKSNLKGHKFSKEFTTQCHSCAMRMMLGPVRPFRLAVLNADNLDAVRSSHISEGDTEKSLMATI